MKYREPNWGWSWKVEFFYLELGVACVGAKAL